MKTEKVKKTIAKIIAAADYREKCALNGDPLKLREQMLESFGLMLTTALADAEAELAAKYKEAGL